ncbi:hypothetical protein BGZ76_008321 [Entomortierella beljakovae]|nr:hypothetical protein BGZ76_008321 [Entomortierella beljakovae]
MSPEDDSVPELPLDSSNVVTSDNERDGTVRSGGSDIVCVYDNDEPIPEVSNTPSQDELDGIEEGLRLQSLSSSTKPDAVTTKQTKPASISTAKRDANTDKGQRLSSGAKKRTASVSNGTNSSLQLQSQNSTDSEDNQPSSKQEDEREDETDEIGSIDGGGSGGGGGVSQLSVKESGQDQGNSSVRSGKREPGSRQHRGQPSWLSNTTVSSANSSPKSSNSQGKIMVELATSKQNAPPPPPAFVIDTSKKARKWGRSGIAFQTLGGMVSIPLWTSDQDMLLNEPKPLHVQQPVPMTTGRKDSSLARLAVLSQLDLDMVLDIDSPERGNTPDSLDGGSPGPASSIKKKRGSRKPQLDLKEDNSIQNYGAYKSSTKKNSVGKRIRTDSGNSTAVDDIDGMDGEEDSAPTSKPSAPTQQRPRTFPCSFEGCSKSFMDKFHLDRHEARHVTDEIVCGIDGCTKAYNSISTVRRHQSMMHKDKKHQMDAAAASIELETEGEGEGYSTKNKQAGAKRNIEKKGKTKTPSINTTLEPIKMSLILKDVKDSAYRPWMDNPTEPIIRTPKDTK